MKWWLFVVGLLFAGCYQHQVNTFQDWCEQIAGVDLQQKYRPFWAVIFAVSFDEDAIRDDFTTFLNDMHMKKVGNRARRMAWQEGAELHLVNLSSLMLIDAEEIIQAWRRGIEADIAGTAQDPETRCLYGTVTSLFDNLHIHSMTADALGVKWEDHVTTIATERPKRLGKQRL